MKARFCTLLFVTLCAFATAASAADVVFKGQAVHPTRVLARLASKQTHASSASALSAPGVSVQQQSTLVPGLVVLNLATSQAVSVAANTSPAVDQTERQLSEWIEALRASGLYEYVEPDYALSLDAGPNDTYFTDGSLWALQNTGQNGGTAGADIDAARAWDITIGSSNVIVAVIDTGIDSVHPDLATQMWRNAGEIAGNGMDDDNNGYIDDIHGINGITGTGAAHDDHGHGTHVAGTIGASANDGSPLVGVAWNIRLMACKFLDASGGGYTSDAIQCIEYAVANGARILNNSWGGPGASQALHDAIAAAQAQDVLFVASAGNYALNTDVIPMYPAAYALDNIISVAAIDRNDLLAGFSNYGSTSVDLGAPGVTILSAATGGDYVSRSGTSMAAPHVTGGAALIMARYPDIPLGELRERLVGTVTPTAALKGKTASGGRFNAYHALVASADGVLDLAVTPGAETTLVAGRLATIAVRVSDLIGITNASVTATAANLPPMILGNAGTAPDITASDAIYTAEFTVPASATSVPFTITASAPGKTSSLVTITYRVAQPPVNDAFARGAVLSSATATATGSNFGATRETGEPEHAGRPGQTSIWWRWTAPFTGAATVTTTGSTFDTLLGIYTGASLEALTPVAFNDDAGLGSTSALTLDVSGGETYQIAVAGYLDAFGDVTLNLALVLPPAPPANDHFEDRTTLTGVSATASGSNVGATRQSDEPYDAAFFHGARSVWWSWAAPASGYVTVDTNGSVFDTTLGVYLGNHLSSLVAVALDDDSGQGDASLVRFYATAGVTYAIVVDGRDGARGPIALRVELAPAPPNDLFASRIPIFGAMARVIATNVNATYEWGEPRHGGNAIGASVWWTWTAPATGEVTLTTTGSSFDSVLAVYLGTFVENLVPITSNDNDPEGGTASRASFAAVAGTTYQIAVDSSLAGLNTPTGSIVLDLTLAPPPPAPANDTFATRTALSGERVSVTGTNIGATREPAEPMHRDLYGGRSVWWSWTAPRNGAATIRASGNPFGAVLAVYSGASLNALTRIGTSAQPTLGRTPATVEFTIAAGVAYQIAVDGWLGGTGTITLDFSVTPAPANDLFADRALLSGTFATIRTSNVGASRESDEPEIIGGGNEAKSIWWTWTAPASGEVVLSTGGSSISALIAAYTGGALTSLSPVAMSEQYGYIPSIAFYAVANRTYQIAVEGVSGAAGTVVLSLELKDAIANDLFEHRGQIAGANATLVASNIGATREANEPFFGGDRSVWWSWTAPSAGVVTLSTLGSSFDTILGVFTGTGLGALAHVASNNDDFLGRKTSHLTFGASAGVTYYIAVTGVNGASGTIQLSLTTAPGPVNDSFSSRTTLTGNAVATTGSSLGATREMDEPFHGNHGSNGASVWWTWTAPSRGGLAISTAGSTFNTLLAVYTGGSVNALTRLAFNDDDLPAGLTSRIQMSVTAGTVYHIAVEGMFGAHGDIALELAFTPTASNDNFASRLPLGNDLVTVSNLGATKEAGEPNHAAFFGGASLWFTWTATSTGPVTFSTNGSSFDTVLAVYTGSDVSALTTIASNADAAGGQSSRVSFLAQSGIAYHIAVDTQSHSSPTATDGGWATVSHSASAASANDNFANRITLAGESAQTSGTNINATRELNEPGHGYYNSSSSVWWTWTAPAAGVVSLSTLGSTFDTTLAVYNGESVTTLSGIASNDDGAGGSPAAEVTFVANAGLTYQIAIDGKETAQGLVKLGLEFRLPASNDMFANATMITSWAGTIVGDSLGATAETGEPGFGDSSPAIRTLWWRWTPAATVTAEMDSPASQASPLLAVYRGSSLAALTQVASNVTDSYNYVASLGFRAQAGTTYYLAVQTSAHTLGNFVLSLSQNPTAANDMFAARTNLVGTALSVMGTNVGATREPSENPVTTSYYHSWSKTVWWRWTAPGDGSLVVTTAGSQFDTTLGIYTGSALSSLSMVDWNDNTLDGLKTSYLRVEVIAGTTYQIVVDGTYHANGPITLNLAYSASPANDDFIGRTALTGTSLSVVGTTVGTSAEPAEPAHDTVTAAHSAWWTWTAPISGNVFLKTFGTSTAGRWIGVYTGNTLNSLTTANPQTIGDSTAFKATAGTTYQIAVDSSSDRTSDFVLDFQAVNGPANDAFADRITLAGSSAEATGTAVHASSEPGEPYGSYGRTIWWSWTAPTTGGVQISTTGSEFNAYLDIFTGGSLNTLNHIAGAPNTLIFSAISGTAYHIRIDSAHGKAGTVKLAVAQNLSPTHDNFASRETLSGTSSTDRANNRWATFETGEPSHGTNYFTGGRSTWWTWQAPQDGIALVSTLGSDFDTMLAVYTGSALTTLVQVARNDDASGTSTSSVAFAVTAGTAYQIAVDGKYWSSGNIVLAVDMIAVPGNDDFADRLTIAGDAVKLSAHNFGASNESGEPTHAGYAGGTSVWWSWTPAASGLVTIRTNGSACDTLLAVYTGSAVNALSLVASDDDSGPGVSSALSIAVTAGSTYQIAVDGKDGDWGTVALAISFPASAPANDNFANRIALGGGNVSATGSNLSATRETGEPTLASYGTGRSVWWTWTAPASGEVTLTSEGSSFENALAVYQGSALSALTHITSGYTDSYGQAPHLRFFARADAVYQIVVDSFGASSGAISLVLAQGTPPSNDDFGNSVQLSGSSLTVVGSNTGASRQTNEPSDYYSQANSVWWSWTPTASGVAEISTAGSEFDTTLAVHTGSNLGGLTQRASNNDEADQIKTSKLFVDVVAGTAYRISVNSAGSLTGAITLAVQILAPPVNDDFADRIALNGTSVAATGSNLGASTEVGEPEHTGWYGSFQSRSVWWKWTAPTSGECSIATYGSDPYAYLAVYVGNDLASLEGVTFSDTTANRVSDRFFAVAGTEYQIALFSGSEMGTVALHLNLAPETPNDNFAYRYLLNGTTASGSSSNTRATREASEPLTPGSRSVWWSWTAASAGAVTITTEGSNFDTYLAVYTGDSLPALELIATNDDVTANRRTSGVTFGTQPGITYQILVDTGYGVDGGNVLVNLRLSPPPVNDLFANRIALNGTAVIATGSNVGATGDPNETNHGSTPTRSVWWSWTAPGAGAVTIDSAGSAIDTSLAIYTGTSVNALTPVPALGSASTRSFVVTPGVTYQISINSSGPVMGPIVLAVHLESAEVNDMFADRLSLSGTSATTSGSTATATGEPQEPYIGYNNTRSVWWSWTPAASGQTTISTSGSGCSTTLVVFTGSSLGALTYVTIGDNNAPGGGARVSFEAVAGTTYQIAVQSPDRGGLVALSLQQAAPPANDNFADARVLSAATTMGTITSASLETGESIPGVNRSVWWKWTAPADLAVTLSTGGSGFDTRLGVFTGSSVPALTTVAINDSDPQGGQSSRVIFSTSAGTTYYFSVMSNIGWGDPLANGTIVLSFATSTRELNDDFADRLPLSGTTTSVAGSTAQATREAGEPNHANGSGSRSIWYTWTAPHSGEITMATSPLVAGETGSNFNTILAVYTGDHLESLVSVASNDDDPLGGRTSRVVFNATSGTAYHIAIDGGSGERGTATLNLAMSAAVAAPTNDMFANRTTLTGSYVSASGSTRGATNEAGEPLHVGSTNAGSAWWSWTAPRSGPTIIATAGSSYDTVLAVYSGSTVGGLTLLANNDNDWSAGVTSRVLFHAAAGQTYQIAVDGTQGRRGTVMLALAQTEAPANDAFGNSREIDGIHVSASGSNIQATKEAGEPNHANNVGGSSVWWKWTAPSSGAATIHTAESSFNTLLAIYTGSSVANLTSVAANNDDPVIGATSRVTFETRKATTYYIAVDGAGAPGYDTASGSIVVRVNLVPPTPPQITSHPRSQTIPYGSNATFTVTATGTAPLTYSWRKDGTPITAAKTSILTLANVRRSDPGSYDVIVTNEAGAVTSNPAQLIVSPQPSRLVNVSIRTVARTGDATLIVGLYVGGSGTKPMLLRAVGPTLALLNVTGAIADPALRVYAGEDELAANDNWGGMPALTQAFTQTGAFFLDPGSKDAALLLPLPAGPYTTHVARMAGSTGVVLVEAYDADVEFGPARLLNLSGRTYVGTGDDVLIAGFVIEGETPLKVLVRGIGPTLHTSFGVNGVLADPQLAVYSRANQLLENDNWGGNADLLNAFQQVSAFALPGNSADAAVLLTLDPGLYTAHVRGANGSTGVGLVEIYEVP